jgi:hypothetical protein
MLKIDLIYECDFFLKIIEILTLFGSNRIFPHKVVFFSESYFVSER